MGQGPSFCNCIFPGVGKVDPFSGASKASSSGGARGPAGKGTAGNDFLCAEVVEVVCVDFASDAGRQASKSGFSAQRHPLDTAGLLSRSTISWLTPVVRLANKRTLKEEDVWPLPSEHDPEETCRLFAAAWRAEQGRAAAVQGRVPSVGRALVAAFWPQFVTAAVLLLAFACTMLTQPFLIRALLNFLRADSESDVGVGFAYAGAMLVCSALSSLLISNYSRTAQNNGMVVKSALMYAVFQHSMRLSSAARHNTSVGQTTNLMSVDTEKLYMACRFAHFVWLTPFMTVVVGALLTATIGPAALAGLALIVLLWPAQFFLAWQGGKARKIAMDFTDERVKFIMEVVSGIRVMKLCAWENAVFDRTSQTRQQEVRWLSRSLFLKAVTREGILVSLPPATLAVIFAVQLSQGVLIDGTLALMALGFLNTLRFPFNLFAASLAACQDGAVSCTRLRNFLVQPIVNEQPSGASETALIQVENASFAWSVQGRGQAFSLEVDRLNLEGCANVAVIGRVASGKSSLIAALLGEMEQTRGTRELRGRIAYMGQTPWIQNMSLRDNIVFGHAFERASYEQVLDAAALGPDLEVLKDGDLTEIGERGINLSGGQKARVALARCLYAVATGASDVMILDCPFDALDAPTGQRVYDGIAELAKNALVLCAMSAQVHLLPRFDQILVVEAGKISMVDGYAKVASRYPELVDSKSMAAAAATGSAGPIAQKGDKAAPKAGAKKPGGQRPSALARKDGAKSGDVSARMLLRHLGEAANGGQAAGFFIFLGILAIFLAGQTCRIVSDVLLVDWASGRSGFEPAFVMLGACVVLLSLRVVSTCEVSRRASLAVHSRTFWCMLRAPVSEYFDVTTSGEIVNKFSKDLETGDSLLPETCMQFLSNSSQLATIGILSTYAIPWFAAVLAVLGIVFVFIGRQFVGISRDLKRLEGSTRSPVFNVFAETLSGLETIRAWKAQERFLQEFHRRAKHNLGFFFAAGLSESWVMARLEAISFSIIGAFAFSAVLMRGNVEPQLVGLAMVYAIQLTAMLQRTVQLSIMINQQSTSLERVRSFESVPQEPALTMGADKALPKAWPHGEVSFEGVQMRYRGGDLVLDGISFTAAQGERIGICGRTGSGKSSLTSALFRIVELSGGAIRIDGMDISKLGLHTLRSKLSIIPQEPVIFSGSLRTNLDPFGSVGSDDALSAALRRVGLGDLLQGGGLEMKVAQNGENLSQGQRQLLCVARVMVRPSRVTVLDEATSSMDAETDRAVQVALAEHWKSADGSGSTMLTVAHRLSTILDYDKILVLSFGQVAEFGRPSELLRNGGGAFSRMLGEERKHGDKS